MLEHTIRGQDNVWLLWEQRLEQLVFNQGRSLKKEASGNVSSAGGRLAGVLGIFEVAPIDQKITILAEAMVKDMMIPVFERVVLLWRKIGCVCRMNFDEVTECLETLTRHVFLLAWFVIGTVPLADKFNCGKFLKIHIYLLVPQKENQTC